YDARRHMCVTSMLTHRSVTRSFSASATAATEIYALSLHDALPICVGSVVCLGTDKAAYPVNAMGMSKAMMEKVAQAFARNNPTADRKSTRLNSSHVKNSYAVFCLKQKKI